MNDFNRVLYSLIGEKLKNLRLEKGLNQTELSEKIPDIGRTSISNIEKGKQQPPLHIIYLICNILDVDIHVILPTYSDVIDKINLKKKGEISYLVNESSIDNETKRALQEIIRQKS